MNTILSTATARTTLISTLAASVLAIALPQAAFAETNVGTGTWKLNSTKSSSGTLYIEQRGQAASTGRLIVVRKEKAYLATGQDAKDILAGKQVDESKLTIIGSKVHATGLCNFRCQSGLPERQATLSFVPMDPSSGPRSVVASSK